MTSAVVKNKKEETLIFKTTDYRMFKTHPRNRVINYNLVNNLQISIKSKNLLHYRPLLVTSDFVVLDGQHRLKAAEMLSVPIFYQVVDDADAEMIIIKLNATSRPWSTLDHVNFFRDNEHYRKLVSFATGFSLSVPAALSFFACDMTGLSKKGKLFKEGLFKYPEDDSFQTKCADCYTRLFNELFKFNIPKIKHYKSKGFIRAFVAICKCPLIDLEVLIKKIPHCLHLWIPYGNVEGSLKVILSVYNFRNQTPLTREDIRITN